jgi:hypothetical protein
MYLLMKNFIQAFSLILLNISVRVTALNHLRNSLSYEWNVWGYAVFWDGFATCFVTWKETANISEVFFAVWTMNFSYDK